MSKLQLSKLHLFIKKYLEFTEDGKLVSQGMEFSFNT